MWIENDTTLRIIRRLLSVIAPAFREEELIDVAAEFYPIVAEELRSYYTLRSRQEARVRGDLVQLPIETGNDGPNDGGA